MPESVGGGVSVLAGRMGRSADLRMAPSVTMGGGGEAREKVRERERERERDMRVGGGGGEREREWVACQAYAGGSLACIV